MKRILVSCLVLLAFGEFTAWAVQAPQQRGVRSSGAAPAAPTGAAPVSARAAQRTTVISTPPVSATPSTPIVSARAATRSTVISLPSSTPVVSARAAVTQKVINTGSAKITGATSSEGLVDATCKDKYFGCMDSFCMQDNSNGARCVCSDQVKTYDSILAQIESLDAQSLKLATVGVDRIDMGEKAGEIDKMVNNATNAVTQDQNSNQTSSKTKRRTLNLDNFNKIGTEDTEDQTLSIDVVEKDPLDGLTGNALHDGVRSICIKQMSAGCEKDMTMLQMMYSSQIKNDCAGYELELKKKLSASSQKLSTAQRAMQDAAREAYDNQNKYDLGQCITEMHKCIVTTGGCGEDFSKCTFYNTGEGLSGSSIATLVPGSKISVGEGTVDSIQAKRKLCETSVTKNCVAVKDQVWPSFLTDIAPTLKAAELIAEDSQRQNRLSDISACFLKACKDNMDPNDPDGSYDACLGNPAIMASSCLVVLNKAGVKADDTDQTWGFVKARLASMRVDACTKQVKECLQADDRCGKDYTQCSGMDYSVIVEMCPADKLTACIQNGVQKSVADLTNMVTGIFMNLDNSMLDQCQKLADQEMATACGDTSSCNAFDDNKTIGINTLSLETLSDDQVTIRGLIDFRNLTVEQSDIDTNKGTDPANPVQKYPYLKIAIIPEDASHKYAGLTNQAMATIKQSIDGVVGRLTANAKLKQCVEGRDISQIKPTTGTKRTDDVTQARFPHLLDSYMQTIILSGLAKAQTNYGKQYEALIGQANDAITKKMSEQTVIADGVCWVK